MFSGGMRWEHWPEIGWATEKYWSKWEHEFEIDKLRLFILRLQSYSHHSGMLDQILCQPHIWKYVDQDYCTSYNKNGLSD